MIRKRQWVSGAVCRGRRTLVWAGLLSLLWPGIGGAQEKRWSVEAEMGAAVFFGNTSQTTFTTRGKAERSDSTFELTTEYAFNYGETTGEDGRSFVNKRSWLVGTSLDFRRMRWVSPYLFGRLESSLEKRIGRRYNAGAGGRFRFVRSPRSRVDLRVAILAEHTRSLDGADADVETLARWSGELQMRRSLSGGRVVLSSVATYSPVFDRFANFVVESESSVAFKLSEVVSLKLSLVDNYDSGARGRGARTNNDGQVFFSVLSSF